MSALLTDTAPSVSPEEEGAYLEHISLTLAANSFDLRDLSKRESMCYILELIHHSLKACNKRHKQCPGAQA